MAKVDASKFMGMGRSGLEKKVAVNSKKITLLKNIVQAHQSKLGENLASLSGGGLTESIQSITNSVTSISETLLRQQELDKDKSDDAAQIAETNKRNLRENLLEGKGKGDDDKSGPMKALAPVKSFIDKIKEWLIKLITAKVIISLFKWFGDPANQKKVSSIFRFIKDWWPAILTGLLLFAGSMLGPGGIILAVGALVIGFIPKIINTVKSLLGFTRDTTKEAAKGEKEANRLTGDQDKPDMDPANAPEPGTQQTPIEMNKGGEVPGSGNKDTVPAMLTPGEFVMSKGAVSKWGLDTLEGMNAAAGGKNTGSSSRGYSEGGQVQMNNETDQLAKRIDPLITGEPEQHTGVKGALMGGLDAITGGLFDFDGKSGGGLLANVQNSLSGMFGGKTDEEGDLDLRDAIADLQDRFNYSIYDKKAPVAASVSAGGGLGGSLDGFISTLAKIPLVGPKIAEAGEDLVTGVEGMIEQQHIVLHKVAGGGSPLHVSGEQAATATPGAPTPPSTTVAYQTVQEGVRSAGGGASASDPGGKIPDFPVGTKVSPHKVKVLGISR